jgi:hypothetical protein
MDEYPAVKTIFEEALAGIVGCAAIYESRWINIVLNNA